MFSKHAARGCLFVVIAVVFDAKFPNNVFNDTMETKRKLVIEMMLHGKTPTEITKDLRISRMAVYSIKKQFQECGNLDRHCGQGRKRTAHTKTMLKATKGRIERNPVHMMRGMARDLNISESMI